MQTSESDRKQHWEHAHRARSAEETSWYQRTPGFSLAMIENASPGFNAPIIDVGGGASLLVDHLLGLGYQDLTVLDISASALARAADRLGDRAATVNWLEQDVTRFKPTRQYGLWHDRAAFHFLKKAEDRKRYMAALRAALTPRGQVILATFAPGGPEKCSGLDIVQYDPARMSRELGPEFTLLEHREERHLTPAGREQLFGFFRFHRKKR